MVANNLVDNRAQIKAGKYVCMPWSVDEQLKYLQ